jgi:hypothetical protein
MDIGARKLGMGSVGSGLLDDIFALFNNPGSLPWTKGVAVSLKDMANTAAAQSYPTGFGASLALGVSANKTELFSTSGGDVTGSSFNSLSLAAGTRLDLLPLIPPDLGRVLGVGLSINALIGQTLVRPGRIDATGNGWDMDLGLLYRYSPWLTAGASAHNILPFNTLGGGVIRWTNGNQEGFPVFYRGGVAARVIGDERSPWQNNDQELLLAADLEYQNLIKKSTLRLGGEWTFPQKYFLRMGFSPDLALGGGAKFGDWQLDASISKDPLKNDNLLYFSISYYPSDWLILSKPIKKLNVSDGQNTYDSTLEVVGEVYPNVKLKINNQPIALREDQTFTHPLKLDLGENPLVFETIYEGEKAEKKIRLIRKPLPHLPVNSISFKSNQVIYSGNIDAKGMVEPGSELTMNDVPMPLAGDQSFAANIALRPGKNVISVKNRLGGKDIVKNYVIYRKPLPQSPVVSLNLPKGNKTKSEVIGIKGRAQPGLTLTMNNEPVDLKENGDFQVYLTLNPGKNTIRLEGRQGDLSVAKQYTITYLAAPQKLAPEIVEEAPPPPPPKEVVVRPVKKARPPVMMRVLPRKVKPLIAKPEVKPAPQPVAKPIKPLKIPKPIKVPTEFTEEIKKLKQEARERAKQEENIKKLEALRALLKEKTGFTITARVPVKLPKGYLAVYQLMDEQYVALRHLGAGRVAVDSYDALAGLWTTKAVLPYSDIKNLL